MPYFISKENIIIQYENKDHHSAGRGDPYWVVLGLGANREGLAPKIAGARRRHLLVSGGRRDGLRCDCAALPPHGSHPAYVCVYVCVWASLSAPRRCCQHARPGT